MVIHTGNFHRKGLSHAAIIRWQQEDGNNWIATRGWQQEEGNNLLSSGLSSGLTLLAALITLELLKTETEIIALLLKSIYLT